MSLQWHKRPELPPLFVVDSGFFLHLPSRLVTWIGSPPPNPFLKQCDLVVAQLTCGRHLQIGIPVTQRLNKKTFSRISWHDDDPGISALPHPCSGIKQEPPFHLAGSCRVAFITVRCQQRTDLGFKKRQVVFPK